MDRRRHPFSVEGAIMLAPEIVKNTNLTSLNISDNQIGVLVTTDLGEAHRDNTRPWMNTNTSERTNDNPGGLTPLV